MLQPTGPFPQEPQVLEPELWPRTALRPGQLPFASLLAGTLPRIFFTHLSKTCLWQVR